MNRIIDLPAQKPENPIVQDDRSQSCKYRRPIARAEQIADCHHADQDDERHDISQQNRDRSRTSGYSDRHPVTGTIRRRSRSTYLHDFLPGLTQTAGFAGLAAPAGAMSRNFHKPSPHRRASPPRYVRYGPSGHFTYLWVNGIRYSCPNEEDESRSTGGY